MFINDKIMFDLYRGILFLLIGERNNLPLISIIAYIQQNIAKMKKILAYYSKYKLVTFSNAIMLCTIRAAVKYS